MPTSCMVPGMPCASASLPASSAIAAVDSVALPAVPRNRRRAGAMRLESFMAVSCGVKGEGFDAHLLYAGCAHADVARRAGEKRLAGARSIESGPRLRTYVEPPAGQSGARTRARGGAEEEQRAGTGSDLAVDAARKREVEVARADLDVAELRGALEHDARLLGRMAVGR